MKKKQKRYKLNEFVNILQTSSLIFIFQHSDLTLLEWGLLKSKLAQNSFKIKIIKGNYVQAPLLYKYQNLHNILQGPLFMIYSTGLITPWSSKEKFNFPPELLGVFLENRYYNLTEFKKIFPSSDFLQLPKRQKSLMQNLSNKLIMKLNFPSLISLCFTRLIFLIMLFKISK
jgi:hypothetical protein